MHRVLYDYLGNEINPGDIIKREILLNDASAEVTYFYYGINKSNKGFLYICDKDGNIDYNSKFNSPVDDGISLVNNEAIRWIIAMKKG